MMSLVVVLIYAHQCTHCASALQDISKKREETAAQLEERERLARQLEEEKKTLEEATSHLKGDLMVRVTQ